MTFFKILSESTLNKQQSSVKMTGKEERGGKITEIIIIITIIIIIYFLIIPFLPVDKNTSRNTLTNHVWPSSCPRIEYVTIIFGILVQFSVWKKCG